jgi:uncharacterized protein YjbI with pentapeptide repeats
MLEGNVMAQVESPDEAFKGLYASGTRLFRSYNLERGSLSGLSLDRVKLIEAGFQGGSFEGTAFKRSSLVGCWFDRARAPGLLLQDCVVGDSRFVSAELAGSTWRKIQSTSTDFDKANLSKSLFESCGFTEASWEGADLSEVRFTSVDMPQCNLVRVNFSRAKLEIWKCFDLTLEACDLTGAVMRSALFSNVFFEDCKVAGADFSQADFTTADLAMQPGLEQAVLTGARYSDSTVFPDGFDPKAHGMVRAG